MGAISAMGYGVGKARQQIEHNGDQLKTTEVSPISSTTNILILNGEEQEGKSPEGEVMLVTPQWDGEAIISEAFKPNPRQLIARTRRTLPNPKTMVVELESAQGTK